MGYIHRRQAAWREPHRGPRHVPPRPRPLCRPESSPSLHPRRPPACPVQPSPSLHPSYLRLSIRAISLSPSEPFLLCPSHRPRLPRPAISLRPALPPARASPRSVRVSLASVRRAGLFPVTRGWKWSHAARLTLSGITRPGNGITRREFSAGNSRANARISSRIARGIGGINLTRRPTLRMGR